MHVVETLFAQVMEFVPWANSTRIVQRYRGNAGERTLSCAEQFRAMAFAQLTWRESLRDVEISLSANVERIGDPTTRPRALRVRSGASTADCGR